MQDTSDTPAGWYPDPAGVTKTRYWDGEEWDGRPEGGGRWPDPAPEPPLTTPDGQLLAGWWARLAAFVVDRALLFGFALGVVATASPTLGAWGCLLLSAAAVAAYGVGFVAWRQATPGKLLLGFRIRERERPGPLPLRTNVVRWAVGLGPSVVLSFFSAPVVLLLGAAWLVLDCGWARFDHRRQALHDKAAGTVVARRGRWLGDAA